MKKLLITGGCGFIGSNFIQYIIKNYPDYFIINFDNLSYAGNLDNLKEVSSNRNYSFTKGDITSVPDVMKAVKDIDWVIHFAAESHVDRSISDGAVFVKTNVLGTYNLLEASRQNNIKKFIHVSTDEVYGSLPATGYFTEQTPLAPNSPYSASKAGSDVLVRSYYETYKLPIIITRCSNNYGPYQFPEKLIPLMITNAMADIPLPVYGDGMNVRDWLYVEDHCRAIDLIAHQGRVGEVYNIGGNNEWHNIDIVKLILKELKKPQSLIKFVTDRLGHDRRYAIDSSKLQKELGWKSLMKFENGIKFTIEWYVKNKQWIERIKTGDYLKMKDKSYEKN